MKKYASPRFFITRPGSNAITPLIAVDELPDYVHVTGVSALMSHADTHGMTSLGVEERSLECYDVRLVGMASSTDYEKHLTSSETSASDGPAKSSLTGDDAKLAGRRDVESCSNREIESQEVKGAGGGVRIEPEVDHEKSQNEGSMDVEKRRQEIATHDETQVTALNILERHKYSHTQAKIDALVASHEQTDRGARGKVVDQDPRAARMQAGLAPGKKVYCSHWIRHGECDFIQQGCLYKHEMPDRDTLKAIGIRSIPAWYLVAHPEKAWEQSLSKGNEFSGRLWSTRSNRFPSADFDNNNPVKPGPQVSFPSQGASRFPGTSNSPFVHPSNQLSQGSRRPPLPSIFEPHPPFPRVQELSEQQYQQWQLGNQNRPADFQIVRKPYKSPGYKTFPFQLPPAPVPVAEKPQAQAIPLWESRQSKLVNDRTKRSDKVSASYPLPDAAPPDITILHSSAPSGEIPQPEAEMDHPDGLRWPQSARHNATRRLSPNHHSTIVDATHIPLKPSPPLDPPIAVPVAEQNGSGSSLKSSAKEPETPVPVHRRLFVARGEQRRVNESRNIEPHNKTAALKNGNGLLAPKRDMKRKSSYKDEYISDLPKFDNPKKILSRDDKKHSAAAKNKPLPKQIERKSSQASTQLLDMGK
ncbi:MAG: hypothetical protein Q9222_002383 [Ikaeria aurantiellina]